MPKADHPGAVGSDLPTGICRDVVGDDVAFAKNRRLRRSSSCEDHSDERVDAGDATSFRTRASQRRRLSRGEQCGRNMAETGLPSEKGGPCMEGGCTKRGDSVPWQG